MTDDTANLILEYMRRFDTRLERIGQDMQDLKGRMTGLVEQLVRVTRRLDRVEHRLAQIERRLDLVEG